MKADKKLNRLRIFILCIIGAFIIVIATVIYVNVKVKSLIKSPKNIVKLSRNIPDIQLENVHYEKTKKGHTEWEITARVAHHFQGRDLLTLEGVKMFYYGLPKRTIMILGKQGRIKPSTKDVELLGKVFIKSSDGYKLRTNSLKYTSKTSLITTHDRVFISGKSFSVQGVGMKMNIKTDKVSILHAVKTTLKGNFLKGSIPKLEF